MVFQGRGQFGILKVGALSLFIDRCDEMKILKFVKKCWRGLRRSGRSMPAGIDSHKWESKIEILRHLSDKHH